MKASEPIAEAPGALPFLGHTLPLLRDPLRFLRSLPSHGDMVRIRVGSYQSIVVCDPDLVHDVLVDDRTFNKGGFLFERISDFLGNGLVTCPFQEHRRQRRLVQPAFHRSRFPAYIEIMTEQAGAVLAGWSDGQIIDVPAEMHKITARVLLATMFSTTLTPATIAELLDDLEVVTNGAYLRMFMPGFLRRVPTAGNRRFERANKRLRRTIVRAIADRRLDDPLGSSNDDLLSILLTARDQATEGRGLSDTEVADQVTTFFAAGIETTANLLSWALFFLADDPGVERRLQAEADLAIGGRYPAHLDISAFPFTNQVLTETLRLCPPVWLITRIVSADARLGGHELPSGATIVVSPYLMHHRGDFHPAAERFDPHRWADDDGDAPVRGTFIPFGGGARKCIGADFGISEACSALALIASRWRLRPISSHDHQAKPHLALEPSNLRMRVTARTERDRLP